MSTAQDTFQLLVAIDSPNEYEEIISLLRQAGQGARAHRITSSEDLREHIESDEWDLMLCEPNCSTINCAEAIDILKQQETDIPTVVLSETFSQEAVLDAIQKGAQDAVAKTCSDHLLFVVSREIHNRRARKAASSADFKLNEVLQRTEQLLSDTQDAVAYIADGMHIDVNDTYAEIFGYEDPDDLAAMPIIDLIAAADQDKFKAFLRHYGKNDTDQAEINFTGMTEGGEEFAATMILSTSSFDGEACTQIMVRTEAEQNANVSSSTFDAASGLMNRYALPDQIRNAAVKTQNSLGPASLIIVELDQYDALVSEHGVTAGDNIIKDCADLFAKSMSSDDVIARFGDSSLGIVFHKNAEDTLNHCREFLKLAEDHICELNEGTLQYTCSAGIAAISPNEEPETTINSAFSTLRKILQAGSSNTAELHIAEVKSEEWSAAEHSIEEALEQKRLFLLFQPIVSLRGDSREHYEVFCRIRGNDGEEILPQDFLGSIKDTKLDRAVILEATKKLSMHRANGHDTNLLINLSAAALKDEDLFAWIGVALKAANLPAESIIFQFIEDDLSRNLTDAKNGIPKIQAIGCKVSISQFGRAGSDPLKTLKHISTDYAKIDGNFILSIQDNKGDPQVLKALVSSVSEQNTLTIVPCVENASILANLWQLGVNYIEGNYLQAPSQEMNYEFTEIA